MLEKNKLVNFRRSEYRSKGCWGDATLLDFWQMAVRSFPQKTAVSDLQNDSYSYAELDEASGRLANFLKDNGIEKGDFISFQIPGWVEFTLIYIACLKVGAVANPILPCLRTGDVAYILNKCESKIYFCPTIYRKFDYLTMAESLIETSEYLQRVVTVEKYAENQRKEIKTLQQILQNDPVYEEKNRADADDLAAVLFTSGTESHPKGVMLTHNNIIASERAFAAALNITYLDTIFLPAPTAHAMGFHHGVTVAFMLGATSVLQDRFKAESALKLIEEKKCTCSMGPSPFVYDIVHILQRETYDISSLRFFICGGSPIPRYMFKEAESVGIKMLGVYGATESVPHATHRLDDVAEKIISTDGRAVADIEIKVVNELRQPVMCGIEGEEASRGPNVFIGYFKEPELTERVFDSDGWYYSGDFCIMDKDGYLKITGRKKDIIIRGGENLSSVEIEHILLQHPNVKESAIVGMPDSRLGERICAYVALHDTDKSLLIKDVQDFFAANKIAKCKWPERIEIVKSLPRTASGKVRKFLLRDDIKAKLNSLSS